MTEDIVPSRRLRKTAWIAGVTACFLVAGVGVSAAAIRYDAQNQDVVMKGVEVGGISLGGLEIEAARQRVLDEFEAPLERPLTIEVAGSYFTTSPRELGVTTDALRKFDSMTSIDNLSLPERVWRRATGSSLGREAAVQTFFDERKLTRFVDQIAGSVDHSAVDASLGVTDGVLKISDGTSGFQLDKRASLDQLKRALTSDGAKVTFPGKTMKPAVSKADIGDVIVVKVGENKLLHYRGEELLKIYDVATGTSQYATPKGQFKIINKRSKPTWVNPAKFPGGWGYNLPAKIGPGPGNPLGTRALDLNSPGIRIHGTYAEYSMGYNASHGCIRMRIADSEELFDKVGVGTPVIIVQTAPNRPMPSKLRPRTIEPAAEDDGTNVPGQVPPSPQPSPSPSPSPSPNGGGGNDPVPAKP